MTALDAPRLANDLFRRLLPALLCLSTACAGASDSSSGADPDAVGGNANGQSGSGGSSTSGGTGGDGAGIGGESAMSSGGGGLMPLPETQGTWVEVNQVNTPIARHECAFVQAGDYFLLMGGRESQAVSRYDLATKTWTTGATAPTVLHHFQATTYQGLVYVIGALTGDFPNEPGADHVYTYDPLADSWAEGPLFPPARKRGSAGVVQHNGVFYILGGSTAGHAEGYKPWVDSWDPATNTWTELPDMPHPRDHFFAVLVEDEVYCIGGRRSIGVDDMVRETDVFDIPTQTWRTLPESAFIPITRAGPGIGLIGEEIFVFGGESGDDPGNIPVDDTQAFNVRTQTWRDVSLCPWPVHGSQAIVNNNALYLAAGSPVEGGGVSERLMAFYTGAVSDPVPTAD